MYGITKGVWNRRSRMASRHRRVWNQHKVLYPIGCSCGVDAPPSASSIYRLRYCELLAFRLSVRYPNGAGKATALEKPPRSTKKRPTTRVGAPADSTLRLRLRYIRTLDAYERARRVFAAYANSSPTATKFVVTPRASKKDQPRGLVFFWCSCGDSNSGHLD